MDPSELLKRANQNLEYAFEAAANSARSDPAQISAMAAQIQVLTAIALQLERIANMMANNPPTPN